MVTLSGRYPLGGSPLVVRGVDLTLEGVGAEGAILDAEGMSRAIEVADGASLTLRDVHVVNGLANSSRGASDGSSGSGGGLLIHGAGSSLLMERGSVRDSVATGELDSDGGGGLQHAQKSRPLWPRAPALFSPGPDSETVRTAKGRHALLLHEHRWHRCEEGRERRAGGERGYGL